MTLDRDLYLSTIDLSKLIKLEDVIKLLAQLDSNELPKNLDDEWRFLANKIIEFKSFKTNHEKDLTFILNQVPGMIGQWDHNLINIYSNSKYAEYFSKGSDSIKGMHIRDLLGDEIFQKNLPYMQEALNGKIVSFERDIPLPSGGTKKTLANYIPYKKEGKVSGFVAMVTDITDIKEKSHIAEEQKTFFSHILNSFNEGFVVQDKNSAIIYFNKMAVQILGLSEDQLLGKKSFDPDWRAIKEDGSDFPGEEHPAVVTIKTGQACLNTIMGIRILGAEPKWIKINSFPFSSEVEGKTAAALVTFEDITKQYTDAQTLTSLIHNSPGMIYKFKIAKDRSMSFPFVSAKAFEIYEINENELIRDPGLFLNMIHPDDRESQIQASMESSKNFTDFDWKGRIVTKNNKVKWIKVKGSPSVGYDGSIIYNGIVIDITQEVILMEELNIERVKLAQASRLNSLGELSAGVAHEINNPLMIISIIGQSLEKFINHPEILKDKFSKIQVATNRINKIVNGLRRFSNSGVESNKSQTSIKQIIEDSLTFIKIKTMQNEIKLSVDCQTDKYLLCNSIEIEQVLINLVNNAADAIKYSQEKWIKIEVKETKTHLIIDVIDSGPGVPSKIVDKIFDPFFTTKSVGEGSGLGLCISQGIVRDHGGEINYLNNKNYSCFRIQFPL